MTFFFATRRPRQWCDSASSLRRLCAHSPALARTKPLVRGIRCPFLVTLHTLLSVRWQHVEQHVGCYCRAQFHSSCPSPPHQSFPVTLYTHSSPAARALTAYLATPAGRRAAATELLRLDAAAAGKSETTAVDKPGADATGTVAIAAATDALADSARAAAEFATRLDAYIAASIADAGGGRCIDDDNNDALSNTASTTSATTTTSQPATRRVSVARNSDAGDCVSRGLACTLAAVAACAFAWHSVWAIGAFYSSSGLVWRRTAKLASSSPSSAAKTTVVVVDDFRETYRWLRDNTPEDATVCAIRISESVLISACNVVTAFLQSLHSSLSCAQFASHRLAHGGTMDTRSARSPIAPPSSTTTRATQRTLH